jgi:phosphate transport system permease protein
MEQEQTNINPSKHYIVHKPLAYGKKLYLGEFLAEKFIKLVAFISIAAIFAIFYYVFQEATFAFKSPEKAKDYTSVEKSSLKESSDNLKQEAYNPNTESDASENSGQLKQESYSSSGNGNLKQETYSSTSNEGELKQESYSSKSEESKSTESASSAKKENLTDADKQAISQRAETLKSSLEETAGEKPITFKEMFQPNDYIDNKPDYIWQPVGNTPKFSFIPIFYGALKVTLIGLIIAAPLAILAAIFTVSFAPKWLKEIIKPAIEILAGFPSVVIGFFCLMTLATVIQEVFHTTYRLNSFVGGIGMALAVIPIIYTVTEDALNAIPRFMSEASLALGASRWQTAWRVLLPSAAPGVFAALILGFGRAFGETMIALMATGNAALVSNNIFESVRTMAATIGAEMAEVEFRGVHYGVLFLIGAILFLVTFSLNALAEFYVRKKLMKRIQGL